MAGDAVFRSNRELGNSAWKVSSERPDEGSWNKYFFIKRPSSAEKVKANKDVASPLKELGLRISKFLGLDEEQSVQLLQCYLQEDYRGTRDSLKTILQDERQSQALILKIADYYYEERTCILRCVLHLLTYFQYERHPYRVEYADCVDKLEKELVSKYRQQFEELYKTEAPTWETHGNLMLLQCPYSGGRHGYRVPAQVCFG
ncbi:nucleoporin NUP188 homolog isoform X2 [Trichechus manatus latirostris]|uniref:Nucleoporin NUP188 homolog isoform X2 n=1 Tax=Trichechus manatus latirostris TaxID=127582 RepID=A0A2Y9R4G8_TRIMA|nr:nucleoporin NUP188 homolog isoform X2 [Trichechus manatus latirostris]XP_023586563.1 nucleoporin NUP188 homolog isoform X2 [Trichechus manatus latirostris]XP_023586564.1 nucleoporin NUP188 homolog isoform X2 [Trichechus manatus latirostris]